MLFRDKEDEGLNLRVYVVLASIGIQEQPYRPQ